MRLNEEEAYQLVAVMLSCRARQAGEPADGPSYVKSLAGRLRAEPRDIAIACCDPVNGLLSEIWVKPTIADIARWCARMAEDWHRMVSDDDRHWREERDHPTDRSDRPTIDDLRARHGKTFGLKRADAIDRVRGVAGDDDDEAKAAQRAAANARALDAVSRAITAEYARRGIAPLSTGGAWALPVSPALAEKLGRLAPAKQDLRKRRAKGRTHGAQAQT